MSTIIRLHPKAGSRFGIERETLRVTKDGRLAQTAHSYQNPALSRDFCENQLEIITPVCNSLEEAMEKLEQLDQKARQGLEQEHLWIYSNPPYIASEDEIPVAHYGAEEKEKEEYRHRLSEKYGKRLMTYSGIHFNLSFQSAIYDDDSNRFYLKLLKYTMKHSWLLTMLTAASPVYDISLDKGSGTQFGFDGYASMRNSEKGYWNQFIPILNYDSIDLYCDSIQKYIDEGKMISEAELYLPVRVKPKGNNSLVNLRKGIDHIELRMFDLNPFADLGIEIKDLQFAYLLLIYFASLDDFTFTEAMQIEAIRNHQKAAKYDLSDVTIEETPVIEKAKSVLSAVAKRFSHNKEALKVIQYQENKLEPGGRYAEMIWRSRNV